jgi:hypothetical protein
MATTDNSAYAKGYNSFSGTDIKGVFGRQVIAELQAVSYSVTREKAPLYTMGSADPRSFSRGKRGIAGTLIFVVFDRHALLGTFGVYAGDDQQLKFLSDKDDVRPEASPVDPFSAGVTTASEIQVGATAEAQESQLTSVASDQQVVAVMRIYGVEILNEGCGVSIDDVMTEQQMTYVARTLVGWRPVNSGADFDLTKGSPANP